MKKIVMGIAALAMAASIFAVDFAAEVKVKGDIAGITLNDGSSTISLLGVENTNQKDNDLLQVAFTGDNAGATFKFWVPAGEAEIKMRGLSVWFKPIDQLKITVGAVGLSLYTERLNWWKVPCGASLDQFKGWDHRWSSAAGLRDNEGGIMAELTINKLYIGAGVDPTYDNWFFSKTTDNDAAVLAYGAVVKYQIADAISAGVAWRDDGKGEAKIITAGVEFGNWGTDYYGFLQGKVYFDDRIHAYWGDKEKVQLAGIAIDNYFSYNFGFMKLEATIPVTIRGFFKDIDSWESDPSYMTARIKGTIPLDALSLYFVVGTDEGLNNGPAASATSLAWVLDSTFGDNFNLYGNVGVTFNVGSCALDLGVEVAYDQAAKQTVIAVPFVTKVNF